MTYDLPTVDWTLKQAIAFLFNFENEHYSINGCIKNAEMWLLIFYLKSVLCGTNKKLTQHIVLDISRVMTDIANHFSPEEEGCKRSELFSSLFGMFLRKKTLYEESITNAEASFLIISTMTFLHVTEKFHHISIEYEESQISSGSLNKKLIKDDNDEKLKKPCQLTITNLPLDSASEEMSKNEEMEKAFNKTKPLNIPPEYVIKKPEESLIEILEKITGLLSQEEETINKILALDLWEKIEKKAMGVRLELSTLILIFERCKEFDAKMKTLLEMLTVNFEVVDKLSLIHI